VPPALEQSVVRLRRPEEIAGLWARCQHFHARGLLIMVGTFADPQTEGSMAIFTTREAAEEFATGDPVVRRWELREWNEALAGP
jgi:hypothetical protein